MKRDKLYELINHLSQSSDWIPASILAEKLHTTTRTIRNYVKQINSTIEGQIFIIGSRDGYKWQGGNGDVLGVYSALDSTPDSAVERIRFLMRQLTYSDTVCADRSLTIEVLCEKLFISENTLMQDVEEIRKILKEYDISLHINKGVFSLSGKETDKRRLIYDRMQQQKKDPILSFRYLVYAFPDLNIDRFNNFLSQILYENGLEADGYHVYNLLLYVILQFYRITGGHTVAAEEVKIPNIRRYPDYNAAICFSKIMEEEFSCSFSQEEKHYLTMLFISLCHHHGDIPDFHEDKIELADGLIRHLKTHDFIIIDEAVLKKELINFLSRTIIRNKYKISSENPFEESLKTELSETYDAAAWIMSEFVGIEDIQITQSDLSYLTLLLERSLNNKRAFVRPVNTILICPDFYGLTSDLLKKLKVHFADQLKIEHVMRTCDIEDLPPAELYISLLPSLKLKNLVMISPSFKAEDIFNIQQKLLQIRKEKMIENISSYILENTSDSFFETKCSFKNQEEALDHISDELLKKNVVDESFIQQIKKRERIDASDYHKIIAIPHASLKTIEKDLIYIIISQKPIPWGNSQVNFIFYIISRRDHSKKMLNFCNDIIRLSEDPKITKKILSCNDYSSFISCIQDLDNGKRNQ